jgi:two-component system, OmpR family, response regulator ChvI
VTTVLLVEDDLDTLAAWEYCCAREGYEVKTASDGEAALAVLISVAVDIVVADWRMPKMSGSMLCQAIRNAPNLSGKIFILVSAESTPPAFVQYDCYLRKPVAAGEVLAAMRRLHGDHERAQTRSDNTGAAQH